MEEILNVYQVFDPNGPEMKLCLSFLQEMLQISPGNRATAAQLLEHDWLKTEMSDTKVY